MNGSGTLVTMVVLLKKWSFKGDVAVQEEVLLDLPGDMTLMRLEAMRAGHSNTYGEATITFLPVKIRN